MIFSNGCFFLVAFFILAPISFLCTLHVLYTIRSLKLTSISAILIAILHATQILVDVSTIPNAYFYSKELCSFMGFVHNYAQLSQVVACFMISYYLHDMLVNDLISKVIHWTSQENWNYLSRCVFFIIMVPLITLLPFSTSDYGSIQVDDTFFQTGKDIEFCSLKDTKSGNIWSLCLVYTVAWIFIIASAVFAFRLSFFLYQQVSLCDNLKVLT